MVYSPPNKVSAARRAQRLAHQKHRANIAAMRRVARASGF